MDLRASIKAALAELSKQPDLSAGAKQLLQALGYDSERGLPGLSGAVDGFIEQFPAPNKNAKSEQTFRDSAKSVRILFQVTDTEIAAAQSDLFHAGDFDSGNERSFLFAVVELKGASYPRGQYAAFTREINKRLSIAAVVLFKTAADHLTPQHLTLAFVHRRPHKRKPSRDVLGHVSLIREINPAEPHRAHLDALSDLSLPQRLAWIDAQGTPRNFDALLTAWLDALDTEALNRRFYGDLSGWFKRAVRDAAFPAEQARALSPEEHVIRLITRLMFVWFIREKKLIAEDLFIEERIAALLKDYDQDAGDSYYRAVLQNLFFATLNTEIGKRGFSTGKNTTHRNFSLYRYEKEIADSDQLLALFAQTPFINGGLFDCLDSEEATRAGGYRIDCFTDNVNDSEKREHRMLSIPNRLFFDQEGLIPLFNRYKFTVEENTPIEQEVALDPELLGKVFENLLAAHNPETRDTARKQTGSYYTPRPVVDYMVDEALVAALAQACPPTDGDAEFWQERLRYLLDYEDAFNDAHELFDEKETAGIMRAIADLKALDPAVGSGAFPMGILHKLTLALRRLDPDNTRWEELQRELAVQQAASAFDLENQQQRDAELDEISAIFEHYRDSDFGRKLYLIQNSIFGVDIQPIATQIAKLRFFISLAIEQQPTGNPDDNFGIKPLPNLETRFLSANTLLPLHSVQGTLTSSQVKQLQRELQANKERHFHAATRDKKMDCIRRDDELRTQLVDELKRLGMPPGDADKYAHWKSYDQNAKADWFDPEYMFGVTKGFDVVIGNPPYVRSEAGDANRKLRNLIIASKKYETLYEKWDLYIPFIECGYKMLKEGGFTTLIVSDAYCHARYARKSQDYFLNNSRIIRLDFLGKVKIFDASVHNITYLFQKADGKHNKPERRVHYPKFGQVTCLPTDEQHNLTHRAFFPEDVAFQAFPVATLPLSKICYISYGLRPSSKPSAEEKFVTADLTSDMKSDLHSKPYVEGKHLDNWLPITNLWIEWGTKRSPSQFYAPTFHELHDAKKLLAQRSPGKNPKVCYDQHQFRFSPSSVGFVLWHELSGIRNNSVQKQAKYRDEIPRRADLPKREHLEDISLGFTLKFLLGVMNTEVAHNFLRANRRSNIHLYPDDWKKLPIPDVSLEDQAPIVSIVERILEAKASDPAADTTDLEAEIDQIVYELYDLTPKEITAVEGKQ